MLQAQRRFIPFAAIAVILIFILFYHRETIRSGAWQKIPQSVGLGETIPDKPSSTSSNTTRPNGVIDKKPIPTTEEELHHYNPQAAYAPGTPKPPGQDYSLILVIASVSQEDTGWIKEVLPEIETAIYVADDSSAPLHPPKNKGHEVMIYLSYIIDHYDTLRDINVFMHSHRYSWHNNDLHDNDAAKMIQGLSRPRVTREGYMNMRTHWNPGCPDWMHPGVTVENEWKQEEVQLARSWSELFPLDAVPSVLAQPCCAQFAISRERIQAIPLARYVFFRDWLLRTPLPDHISGRVWEYVWQYLFTGDNVVCPAEHIAYCDGFGICFGNEDAYNAWFAEREVKVNAEAELLDWKLKDAAVKEAQEEGRIEDVQNLEVPQPGYDEELQKVIDRQNALLDSLKADAIERGKDPKNRAMEAGRPWKEGDGF